MATEREKILKRELEAERHRNRHLLHLTHSVSETCSRLAVENYELRFGKRYAVPGKGLSPVDAIGLIDLNERGKLEKAIGGALKSAIEAHGPITINNRSSAAKRVIGILKQHNRDLREKESDG